MDNLTPEQRHKNMAHIKSKDTKQEQRLRLALWHCGVRYRKNWKVLPGKPDIAITRCKIAVFIDGDFWHGRDIKQIDKQVKSNRSYWLPKIKKNIERDAQVNDQLTEMGWMILRFWESDINKDIDSCIDKIMELIPQF